MSFLDYFEDHKVLLIGPGLGSDGKSEVRSLPDLTPLKCKVPIFPGEEYYGYVGRATSDGVHMCGGSKITSSCYLLTNRGYQDIPGLLNKRHHAASILTPQGWWVTGIPPIDNCVIINYWLQVDMMGRRTFLLQNYGATTSGRSM